MPKSDASTERASEKVTMVASTSMMDSPVPRGEKGGNGGKRGDGGAEGGGTDGGDDGGRHGATSGAFGGDGGGSSGGIVGGIVGGTGGGEKGLGVSHSSKSPGHPFDDGVQTPVPGFTQRVS